MNSTTKITFKKIALVFLKFLLPLLFWCLIWEILAHRVQDVFLLPDIKSTFVSLRELITSKSFYSIIGHSTLRVVLGLGLGVVFGVGLGVLSCKINIIYFLLQPLINVLKSTPVVSFILLLWVYLSGEALPVVIAIIMVMPIIWQSVVNGYFAIDKDLLEVTRVFEFSYFKKLKILIFPTILKYLTPAIITSSGLAWKSEIAAEIIGYTRKSIGQKINDARFEHDTARVFAWTVIIVFLSLILESITKYLLRRIKK